ncbi:MAG: hypothetical protein ACRBBW_21835, partial [Cellvibrionaceae bacterium]
GAGDVITLFDGDTYVIAGSGDDTVTTTGNFNDYVLGDHGAIGWSTSGIIEHMTSDKDAKHLGGSDTLSLADGHHWVIGGFGADTITAGIGNDIVLGDNGVATFTAGTLTRLESTDADDTTGGNDIINLGHGNTNIIGGA